MRPRTTGDGTRAVHAASSPRAEVRTVNPAIQRGSTLLASKASALYDGSEVTYGRAGLPIHDALCEALAEMEGALGTRLFPSGLASLTGALLAVLKTGDEVLVVDCVYDPTRRFCNTLLRRFGVTTRYVDPCGDIVGQASEATRVILLESPGSLTFEIQDLQTIAAAARARNIITIADTTWSAGLIHRPLTLGVDISVQALTKYVGGHADLFMGAASTRDPGLLKKLDDQILQLGWATSPDDAYLMLRGVRTLPTRLARHGESALRIGQWLTEREEVLEVLCPALPGARGHELWRRDFTGTNGLITVVLKPSPEKAVLAFLDALKLFGLGFSWGGYESLAIHCEPQLKHRVLKVDYPGPLVRLHVGLEDPDDLIEDLRGGLTALAAA
jgi:cysteine-S-conjugate beta-lyase